MIPPPNPIFSGFLMMPGVGAGADDGVPPVVGTQRHVRYCLPPPHVFVHGVLHALHAHWLVHGVCPCGE